MKPFVHLSAAAIGDYDLSTCLVCCVDDNSGERSAVVLTAHDNDGDLISLMTANIDNVDCGAWYVTITKEEAALVATRLMEYARNMK